MSPEVGTGTIKQGRHEQRMTALAKANEKRTKIAQLKRKIGDREIDAIDVLKQHDHPWHYVAGSMQIQDFLMCIRGFGQKTVAEILSEFSVSGKLQVGQLTMTKRRELIHLIQILQAK
jgi:hypothetical protein